MKRIMLLPLFTLAVNLLFSQPFTEQTGILLEGVTSSSVAWGDYDNDGYLDVLLTGYDINTIPISKIYKNNGNNSFTEQLGISLTGVANGSSAWGDYDNDGFLDILLTGFTGKTKVSVIYRNNGNNTFTEQKGISLTGVNYSSVSWGDYDNDGDLDILLTGHDGDWLVSKIYKNNGNNSFVEQTSISLTGVYYSSVSWSDYDNDGDLDVLICGDTGKNQYISKIYKNNGNNTFTDQTSISLTGILRGSAAWGDYDADGDQDLLITGYRGSGGIISKFSDIFKNNGNNTFSPQNAFSKLSFSDGSVAWGDYDNDGDLDILLTGESSHYEYVSKIYKNNGNNTFTDQTDIMITGAYDGQAAWGDYDNDGDLDIILTTYKKTKIYKNEGLKVNSKPTTPICALPIVKKSSVTLSWNKVTDDQTPTNGLTYNMYIKRVSDNSLAMSPMADVNNGYRRVVQFGNMNMIQTVIQNFDYGEYEWYVQAVDNCFSGSVFTKGQNFNITVPMAPSQLEVITNSGNEITLSWIDNSRIETGFVVERSIDNNQSFSVIGTVAADSIFFNDKGLAPGKKYYYRVKTSYNEIYSEYSNEIIVMTNYVEQTGISLPGISDGSVAWGDYDCDGDFDFLMTGRMGSSKSIAKLYRNNGDNTFTEQTDTPFIGVSNGSIAWGDYDNDNDLDILLTGNSGSSGIITKIYKNNGDNTFTEQPGISLQGVSDSSVAWGDYDNDGNLDILLTGNKSFNDPISKIYRNNGNNTFTWQSSISITGVHYSSVAWGDYDNDSDLDILLSGNNGTTNSTRIYKNNGDNSFTEQTSISLAGVSNGSVAWGDYDNDGNLDILITGINNYNPRISKIYKNNGDGSFSEQKGISLPGISNGSAAWGDYDNDGTLDILLTGTTDGTNYLSKIYKNNGNNNFTDQSGMLLKGVSMSSAAWGDYDNDNDLDIIMIGKTGFLRSSKIYKNEVLEINPQPTSPMLSNPVVDKRQVTLSWEKATDNQISTNGLTYNMFLKEISNDSIVQSSMSDLKSGFRRLPRSGNMNQNLIYRPQNLDGGEYEWYIQSIDQSYIGSIFTKGKNFLVAPIPPSKLAANIYSINEINLSWKDNSKGETGYVIERSVSNNQNFVPIDTLNSNSSTYTDVGVSLDRIYYYRVKALNQDIASEYSNEIDVVTNFVDQTNISLVNVRGSSIDLGDYNNDGNMDIILTGYDGTKAISKIYKNNGDNTFAEQTGIILEGVSGGSVDWGDYDNDGNLDILLTGYAKTSRVSKIYRNNGDNNFTEQKEINLPGVSRGSAAWGDYDNDGDLDILLAGNLSLFYNISRIYRNNGNGTFTEQTGISLIGVHAGSVAWGDYDNDGDLDILLTGCQSDYAPFSKIYRNNSNNTFTEQIGISLTPVSSSSVAWGDYNNDGYLDVLLTGNNGTNSISKIYKNNGDNTFTEQTEILLESVSDGSVSWGDYDNDGDLDILLSGNTKGIGPISKIYKNNGDNTFSDQTSIPLTAVFASSVKWCDYDNDGDLDIFITGDPRDSCVSKVFKNFCFTLNTLPSIPMQMKQILNSNNVTFSWDKTTDRETSQNGLTYNMFIKSFDGKIIKSPLSDFRNGTRKVVDYGNTGQNNTWTIKELPKGIYTWSIQSIDNNYSGSPFAPMKVFVVGNPEKLDTPIKPIGATSQCLNSINSEYSTSNVPGATRYLWTLYPYHAGAITGDSKTAMIDWSDTFFGTAKISVIALKTNDNFGISESSDSLTIVINSPPTTSGLISGSQTVCQGTSGNIYKTRPVSGADSYVWSLPQGAIGASTSDSINVNFDLSAISGEIKVKGQNSCGTGSESAFAVTVHPKPEKPLVSKSGFTLKSNAENGNQWYKQDALIPGANQQELTSTGDGNYYVIVTEEGCSSDPSDAFIVTDIETISSMGMVEVYPNPVAKNLTILPVDNNVITYEFIDLLGKLVKKGSISGKTVIETGSFLPGIYLLKINNGKTTEFIKISKE
jgi:predicted nucleotidyltransferase